MYKRISKEYSLYFYNNEIYWFWLQRDLYNGKNLFCTTTFKDRVNIFAIYKDILLYTTLDGKLFIWEMKNIPHYTRLKNTNYDSLKIVDKKILKLNITRYYFYFIDTNNFLYIYEYFRFLQPLKEITYMKIENVDSVFFDKNSICFDGKKIKIKEIKYCKQYFEEMKEGVLENNAISNDVFNIILSYL